MDRLSKMEVFVAIVDCGSLTAAAKQLGKSQPTVVRSLALLEDELGVGLLTRTTRSLALTEEGRGYLERCRQILADVREAEQELRAQHTELSGLLRVTAPVRFGEKVVLPAVTRFLRAHPRVQIELVLLDRITHLIEEGFDVGVRIALLPDSSLVARRLGEVRRVIVGSPALLNEVGCPVHPSELSLLPTVRFENNAGSNAWTFQVEGRQKSIHLQSSLTTNLVAAGLSACVEGVGFGRFLSYQVDELVRKKKLVVVLARYEPASVPVHVVFASSRALSPRVRAFVDSLELPSFSPNRGQAGKR